MTHVCSRDVYEPLIKYMLNFIINHKLKHL